MYGPYNHIAVRREGATLWVEIHNPPVNFLTTAILEELFDIVGKVRRDPSVRVLILTGGLEDHFIMHFSIPELKRISADNRRTLMNLAFRTRIGGALMKGLTTLGMWQMDWVPGYEKLILALTRRLRKYSSTLFLWHLMHRLYLAIERLDKITIAAINGTCNGGGTEISACFDFRFMINDQAFTIGQPECLVGIVPGGGGSQRWPRLIGKAKALEWMLVGHQLDPYQAEKLGIITGSFPKAEFQNRVQAFADQMSKRIPAAVRGVKEAVHEGGQTGLRHALSIEMEKTVRCFDDPTTQRAMAFYAGILEDRIEVAGAKRATLPEILEMVQSDAFVQRIEG